MSLVIAKVASIETFRRRLVILSILSYLAIC